MSKTKQHVYKGALILKTEEEWEILKAIAEKKHPGKGLTYFINMELNNILNSVQCMPVVKKKKKARRFWIPKNLSPQIQCLCEHKQISAAYLITSLVLDPALNANAPIVRKSI